MAKQRIINTRFWDDNYISNLDPIEKLLFLYLLTNTSTNISGIYEIPIKKIATETGIDKEMVIKIINRFSKDRKIFYYKGWVCIKNFIKHQNQKSPTVKKGIENEIMALPKDILEKMIGYGYGIDTLSHLNLNLNLNLNSNLTIKDNEDIITSSYIDEPKMGLSIIKSYGELNKVKLTDEEYSKLLDTLGNEADELIKELDLYISSTGKRYKSHYATILNWSRRKRSEIKSNSKKVYVGK